MTDIKSLLEQGKFKEARETFLNLSENQQEDFLREISIPLFPAPIMGVLFRKLHPGQTYDDFKKAWLPPLKSGQDLAHYFPYPTYVVSAENIEDASDIMTVGFMWIEEDKVGDLLKTMSGTENQRHDHIAEVAEKIGPTLIYKFKEINKLGS